MEHETVDFSPKNEKNPTVTLPRPRNAATTCKSINMGPHGVVLAIVGCDLGQKNAANLMESM